MKTLLIALLPLAALGCAATPAPGDKVAAAPLICWKEEPVGSNLPVTRCRTEEQMRQNQQGVDSAAAAIHSVPAGKARASGP